MSCLVEVDFVGTVEFDKGGIFFNTQLVGLRSEHILELVRFKLADNGVVIFFTIILILGQVVEYNKLEIVGFALNDNCLAVFKAVGRLKSLKEIVVGKIAVVFGICFGGGGVDGGVVVGGGNGGRSILVGSAVSAAYSALMVSKEVPLFMRSA